MTFEAMKISDRNPLYFDVTRGIVFEMHNGRRNDRCQVESGFAALEWARLEDIRLADIAEATLQGGYTIPPDLRKP